VVQLVTSRVVTIQRWLKRVVLGGVAFIVSLIAGVWVEHSIPVELPRPTGGSPVGRTYRALGPDLTAWIWYPARHNERVVAYLPDSIATLWTHDRPSVINLLTRKLANVRAHGVFEAPFADSTRHPVLLFRGGGRGGALGFTAHFEELASRGYVVVAVEGGSGGNPESCVGRADEEACAAKLIGNAITAMGLALDRLSAISMTDPVLGGHLDLKTVGVFGHSFGGAQAFAFCAADARCKAGVNMDGRLFGSLDRMTVTVPFLWLLSDHGSAKDSVSRQIMGQIQRAYERQPAKARVKAMITGANHFTFSEDGAMLKSGLLRTAMRFMGILGIRGRRQVEVSAYTVATFFDARLRNADSTQGALASSAYPELVEQP
jgi:predicted dienelactone hydrolase